MTPSIDSPATSGLLAMTGEGGLPEGITRLRGMCPNGCGETLESDDDSGAIEGCRCNYRLM
ncbi:hypothetical protein CKJ66_26250 [Mycobacterium avium]|uniref:Uncharacterized protein n=1 Tax=Mycobacterium avium TaxID=1764 RepID=A0A2A2ZBI5_MYCAV|nr:hypothetical protein CKJ66_26250 [Mycobacterium avium]